jgi:hypothetical protein
MMTGDVRKVLTRITGIAQDHYPETMAETLIINMPLSFRLIWAVVKPLLQPRTVNKITLVGTKYLDELSKRVDVKNIPTYMGGQCQSTLLEDVGPWSDERVLNRLRHIEEIPSYDSLASDGLESPSALFKDGSEFKSISEGDGLSAVRSEWLRLGPPQRVIQRFESGPRVADRVAPHATRQRAAS